MALVLFSIGVAAIVGGLIQQIVKHENHSFQNIKK